MKNKRQQTKVMIVDDDPVVRILISEYLGSHGYKVLIAEGGQECLDNLKKDLPDIIVLDLLMPDMNGMQVLKSIRENPRTAGMHVVMLSANSEILSIAAGQDFQADSYIQKPFELSKVIQTIETGKQKEQRPA